MRFLQLSDYKKASRYDLETLLQEDPNPYRTTFDIELQSQETISLFLRKRYDLNCLFQYYPDWQPLSTGHTGYAAGDVVWFSAENDSYTSFLYKASRDTTESPTDDPDSWILYEPRYALIVSWMVSLALYKLHERVNPDVIPQRRQLAGIAHLKRGQLAGIPARSRGSACCKNP